MSLLIGPASCHFNRITVRVTSFVVVVVVVLRPMNDEEFKSRTDGLDQDETIYNFINKTVELRKKQQQEQEAQQKLDEKEGSLQLPPHFTLENIPIGSFD